MFDFVIPRCHCCGKHCCNRSSLLVAVDSVPQNTAAGALILNENALLSGECISHQPGSGTLMIRSGGIYQAILQATVTPNPCTAIPAEIIFRLEINGRPVPGGVARHTFAASGETATLSFNVPFYVADETAYLQVVASRDGFVAEDLSLTVIRLGDLEAST